MGRSASRRVHGLFLEKGEEEEDYIINTISALRLLESEFLT